MDNLLKTCKPEVALGKQHATAAYPKDKLVFKFFLSPEIQTLRERGGPGDLQST